MTIARGSAASLGCRNALRMLQHQCTVISHSKFGYLVFRATRRRCGLCSVADSVCCHSQWMRTDAGESAASALTFGTVTVWRL